MVPGERLELSHGYPYQILSLARLPISPPRPEDFRMVGLATLAAAGGSRQPIIDLSSVALKARRQASNITLLVGR